MYTDIGAFLSESTEWRIKSLDRNIFMHERGSRRSKEKTAPGMIVIARCSLIKAPLANCYKCRAGRRVY